MATKYEQLIEYIINENEEKARELFHEIVVEKSREIYESIVDEEDLAETDVTGISKDISDDEERGFIEGEDEEGGELDMDMDAEGGDEEGNDAEVDMDMDDGMGLDDEGDDEEGGDLEGKVMDLEAELDELSAKFDELMAGDEGDDMGDDMGDDAMADMGDDEGMEGDDMDMDMGGEEEPVQEYAPAFESKQKSNRKMTEAEWIREYVEKIGDPFPGKNSETGEVGDGGSATLNKQSIVAGKNDMGGTAQNIAKGGSEADPKGPKTTDSGLLKKGGEYVKDITNRPGGMKKSTAKTANEPGHGAEKKSGPEGRTTGDSASVDKKSVLGSK